MTTFVIETYLAREQRDAFDDAIRRISRTIARRPDGGVVRHVRSVFIPEDETCFHLVEAATIEAVVDIAARAEIVAERVVEAEALDGLPDA